MKIEKFEKYKKITPEDGFVFTNYKDGDNILTYTSAKIIFAPLHDNLENWREITIEENEKYLNQLEKENKI